MKRGVSFPRRRSFNHAMSVLRPRRQNKSRMKACPHTAGGSYTVTLAPADVERADVRPDRFCRSIRRKLASTTSFSSFRLPLQNAAAAAADLHLNAASAEGESELADCDRLEPPRCFYRRRAARAAALML